MLFGLKGKDAFFVDLVWCLNLLILVSPLFVVGCGNCSQHNQTVEGYVTSVDFVAEDLGLVVVVFHFEDNRIVKLRMRSNEIFDCKMDQQIKIHYDSNLLIKKIEKQSLDFH